MRAWLLVVALVLSTGCALQEATDLLPRIEQEEQDVARQEDQVLAEIRSLRQEMIVLETCLHTATCHR